MVKVRMCLTRNQVFWMLTVLLEEYPDAVLTWVAQLSQLAEGEHAPQQ